MRGEITLKVLEALKDAALDVADVLEVFLSAPYGTSFRAFRHRLTWQERRREKRDFVEHLAQKRLQRYHDLMYKLKRDGLIRKIGKDDKKFFFITDKGKKKLAALRAQTAANLPRINYKRREGNKLTIVTFDVPEKDKGKRRWLRDTLRFLGFTMLQKSVWVGKVMLPQEFIDDLHHLRLTTFVEIFEIGKTGSLEHIA